MSLSKPTKTPYFNDGPLKGGTTKALVLTSYTHGGKDESRIFHTEEDSLHFEYS